MGDNNTNYGTNNGWIGSIHNEAPRRTMTPELRQQLLAAMDKSRVVHVSAPMGDEEAVSYANEAWDFLKSEGYQMAEGGVEQQIRARPIRGSEIRLGTPGHAVLNIGHR